MTGAPAYPEVAQRDLGGSVVWCNDDFYADVHSLITSAPPVHDRLSFAARGKVYDGWETRRRREPGEDVAIIRLAAPAVVHAVTIDTAHFRGNFPPEASIHTTVLLGYPDVFKLQAASWITVLDHVALEGDTRNHFDVGQARLATHVKLVIHPDGGVARLRVFGEVVADPALLGGRIDLAATVHGGRILACSNMFYSSPANVIAPGRSAVMSDGWETARRRQPGNEWLTVGLTAPAVLHSVVIDTGRFVGNAPAGARLTNADTGEELLAMTPLQPDIEHCFRVRRPGPVARVKLDIYPDGGISRLRVFGEIDAPARVALAGRWLSLLPADQAAAVDPSEFFS
jgi:allantoicase